MGNRYWINRELSARIMAERAVSAEVRLIHYELAGHYSIMAAQSSEAMAQPRLHAPGPNAQPDGNPRSDPGQVA